MNVYTVECPYCAAEPGEPCRHTMLAGRTTEPHTTRVEEWRRRCCEP